MRAAHEAGELAFFATETFPRGYCGIATDFWCQYLLDVDSSDVWLHVSGEVPSRAPGPRPTHAWAQQKEVIVDVTGGQFPGRPDVFVGLEDSFFRTITRTGSVPGGIGQYTDADAVRAAYEAVLQRVAA